MSNWFYRSVIRQIIILRFVIWWGGDVRSDFQDSNDEDEENEDESEDKESQVTMSKMKSFNCVDFLTPGGLSSSSFSVVLPAKTEKLVLMNLPKTINPSWCPRRISGWWWMRWTWWLSRYGRRQFQRITMPGASMTPSRKLSRGGITKTLDDVVMKMNGDGEWPSMSMMSSCWK